MSKIRINDLARELEVKSKAILDVLPEVGVTEKKTHSSSLEDHEAEKVRAHFRVASDEPPSAKPHAPAAIRARRDQDQDRSSHISKPGDVLKLITQKQQPRLPRRARPPRPARFRLQLRPRPVDAAPAPPAAAPQAVPKPPLHRHQLRELLLQPARHGQRSAPSATRPQPPAVPTPPVAAPPPCAAIAATPATPKPRFPRAPVRLLRRLQRQCGPECRIATRPATPLPRMIMPQTGPRPVYKAPAPPPTAAGAPPTVQHRAGRYQGSRFSSVLVRAHRPELVLRCVRENVAPCIQRGSRRPARVLWALVQACRRPDRFVPEAVPERRLVALGKGMFREE